MTETDNSLISETSALARIPQGLNDLQRGWLEGLRFSVEICDLSYRRLCTELLVIADAHDRDPTARHDSRQSVAALTDAWTFVDAAWRLKRLLLDRSFPRPVGAPAPPPEMDPSQTTIDLKAFRAAIKPVKNLRDVFQHIDDTIARNDVRDKLVWGHIYWQVPRVEKKCVNVFTLVPGTMPRTSMPFDWVDTQRPRVRSPIDLVTLNAFNARVDLTEIYFAIADLARQFEAVFAPQFEGKAVDASGLLIVMTMTFGQMGPSPEDAP